MHIANYVEGPMFVFEVVPERLAFEHQAFDFFRLLEDMNVSKSFALQPTQRAPQLLRLIANHMRSKIAIWTSSIAVLAKPFRKIEDQCDRENMEFARQGNQRLA